MSTPLQHYSHDLPQPLSPLLHPAATVCQLWQLSRLINEFYGSPWHPERGLMSPDVEVRWPKCFRERQTDDRQTEINKETDRETDKQRERDTDRQSYRKTERQIERHLSSANCCSLSDSQRVNFHFDIEMAENCRPQQQRFALATIPGHASEVKVNLRCPPEQHWAALLVPLPLPVVIPPTVGSAKVNDLFGRTTEMAARQAWPVVFPVCQFSLFTTGSTRGLAFGRAIFHSQNFHSKAGRVIDTDTDTATATKTGTETASNCRCNEPKLPKYLYVIALGST